MSGPSIKRRTSRLTALLTALVLLVSLSACSIEVQAAESLLTVVYGESAVSYGMTRAQVERQLGKPEKENQMPPAGGLEDGRYGVDEGTVNIIYRKDQVVLTMVRLPGWTTPEGVGVGSTLEAGGILDGVLRAKGLDSLPPVQGLEGYAYLACYRRQDGALQPCTPEDYQRAGRENAADYFATILGFDQDGSVREISMGDKLCLQYLA